MRKFRTYCSAGAFLQRFVFCLQPLISTLIYGRVLKGWKGFPSMVISDTEYGEFHNFEVAKSGDLNPSLPPFLISPQKLRSLWQYEEGQRKLKTQCFFILLFTSHSVYKHLKGEGLKIVWFIHRVILKPYSEYFFGIAQIACPFPLFTIGDNYSNETYDYSFLSSRVTVAWRIHIECTAKVHVSFLALSAFW